MNTSQSNYKENKQINTTGKLCKLCGQQKRFKRPKALPHFFLISHPTKPDFFTLTPKHPYSL